MMTSFAFIYIYNGGMHFLSCVVHCFRFIAALKGIPDEEELKYTTKLIETNFSNYSAWHNRRYMIFLIFCFNLFIFDFGYL